MNLRRSSPFRAVCAALLPFVAVLSSPLRCAGQFEETEAAVILDVPLVRTGVGAGEQTRGYTFQLETPRTLTHLGLFSYNGSDTVEVDRRIGVWDADGALVTEVTVPVGGGIVEDLGDGIKFIYEVLESPAILLPEVVYTVGVWYSVNNSPGLAFNVDFTTIEGFSYLQTVETGVNDPEGMSFKQPVVVRDDRLNAYIGPNLRFDLAIPNVTLFTLNEVSLDAESGLLTIKWDSKAGKTYDLLSSDTLSTERSAWEVFEGMADIDPAPPENTLSFALPDDARRFFAIRERVPPPTIYFQDDLEDGSGWTTGSDGQPGTLWELGTPTGAVGPVAAASGVNCFGTNLGGEYAIDANVWLRSPAIDLTDPTLTSATLSFNHFKDIETSFDYGSIQLLDAGTGDPIGAALDDMIEGISPDWESYAKALPSEALGRTIRIEFRFQSEMDFNFAGWYIDDVLVTGR